MNKIYQLILLLIFISSCSVFYPSEYKSINSFVEYFYLGERDNQTYIKPLVFENSNDEVMKCDFTIREKHYDSIGVKMNFSIFSDDVFDKLESITIQTTDENFVISDISKLFIEKKDSYHIRSTVFLPRNSFESIFRESNYIITIKAKNGSKSFKQTNSTSIIMKRIYNDVIVLLD